MKNLILLTISLMVLFSTSLVFACGDGQDSSDRSAQAQMYQIQIQLLHLTTLQIIDNFNKVHASAWPLSCAKGFFL